MYPNYATILDHGQHCPYCFTTLPHGRRILKPPNPHYIPYCSAYMMSKDLAHVSILPVNCTAKYWNRVLCVRESNKTEHQEHTGTTAGKGEYKIYHSTLIWSNHMCPDDYNILINGMCMKLTQIPDVMLRHKGTYNLMRVYKKHHKICRNSTSYPDIRSKVSPGIKLIRDILEEFYAKGSELYLGQKINPHAKRCEREKKEGFYSGFCDKNPAYRYVWFSPPLYATYMPCFSDRRQITENKISQYMAVYTCQDGSVVSDALLCDGRSDCLNSEDEQLCSVCSDKSVAICFSTCAFPSCQCNIFYYQCRSGGCVHYDHVCDSLIHCQDGDDEIGCHLKRAFDSLSEVSIRKSYLLAYVIPQQGIC